MYERILVSSHYDGGNNGWGNLVEVYQCYDAEGNEWTEEERTPCDEDGLPLR